jgi:hypothetical protein
MSDTTAQVSAFTEPALVCHAVSGIEGRSLTGFMHRVFVVVQDENYDLGGLPGDPEETHPIDPASLSAIKMFTFRGHGLPRQVLLGSTYPEIVRDPRFLLFAVLPDPLRSAAHAYGWYAGGNEGQPKSPFADFLDHRKPNIYANAMGCRWWNISAPLRRYFFLGPAERAADCVTVLSAKIERAFAAAPQTPNVLRARYFLAEYLRRPEVDDNAGDAEIDERIAQLPAGVKEKFRKRNWMDYRIYEHACRGLERDLAAAGDPREAVVE